MSFQLSYMTPSIVVAGAWNAAILTDIGWVCEHLLGIPAGQEFEFQQTVVAMPQPKFINLFDKFGMCCADGRLEFYLRVNSDADGADPAGVYDALRLLAQKLPYTPVHAVGVNFRVQTSDQVDTLASLMETHELFDSLGSMQAMQRVDDLSLSESKWLTWADGTRPPVKLKLERATNYAEARLDINYHTDINSVGSLVHFCEANPISYWRSEALSMLTDIYGIEVESETFY